MNTRVLSAIAASVIVGVLAGCGTPAPKAGHVTSKQFIPAHEQQYLLPIVVGCGKGCTTTILIPETEWVADEWSLQLTNAKQSGWIDVSQQQYAKAKLGQWWGGGKAAPTHVHMWTPGTEPRNAPTVAP